MPKFRKKYVPKGKYRKKDIPPADRDMLRERKEDLTLRSSSYAYKDDIDSV